MKATIVLTEESIKRAEDRLDRFGQDVQNGVTIWSAKGLLFSTLSDLGIIIVEKD